MSLQWLTQLPSLLFMHFVFLTNITYEWEKYMVRFASINVDVLLMRKKILSFFLVYFNRYIILFLFFLITRNICFCENIPKRWLVHTDTGTAF